MVYWYIAKNEQGEIGTVPGNYLESDKPPPLPGKINILLTSSISPHDIYN